MNSPAQPVKCERRSRSVWTAVASAPLFYARQDVWWFARFYPHESAAQADAVQTLRDFESVLPLRPARTTVFQTEILLVIAQLHFRRRLQPFEFHIDPRQPPLRDFRHRRIRKPLHDFPQRRRYGVRVRAAFHLKIRQQIQPARICFGLCFGSLINCSNSIVAKSSRLKSRA